MPKNRMHQRMHVHDYTHVGFYMITMTTAARRPLFGECKGNLCHLNRIGHRVRQKWEEIPLHRPQIEASTLVVMPDHLHGILFVKEELSRPVGHTIRGFASGVTSELRKTFSDPLFVVWERGFHDRVIMSSDMLKAERNYIRDNPRRFCIKQDNPDLFVRVNCLRHSRLPEGYPWAGYGNLFLLDRPNLIPIQVSRGASECQIENLKVQVCNQLDDGAVPVSPFLSLGEKDIARMVMERNGSSLILIRPAGFPPLYKPSGAYFDLCAKDRLLVLTAFQYTGRRQTLSRECCLQMNQWVKEICANNGVTR